MNLLSNLNRNIPSTIHPSEKQYIFWGLSLFFNSSIWPFLGLALPKAGMPVHVGRPERRDPNAPRPAPAPPRDADAELAGEIVEEARCAAWRRSLSDHPSPRHGFAADL